MMLLQQGDAFNVLLPPCLDDLKNLIDVGFLLQDFAHGDFESEALDGGCLLVTERKLWQYERSGRTREREGCRHTYTHR